MLVTFKSRLSVPPYRIENKTSDVIVYFAQSSLKGTREKWNWLAPRSGGRVMAYAWDEPTAEHRLQVQVSTKYESAKKESRTWAVCAQDRHRCK